MKITKKNINEHVGLLCRIKGIELFRIHTLPMYPHSLFVLVGLRKIRGKNRMLLEDPTNEITWSVDPSLVEIGESN